MDGDGGARVEATGFLETPTEVEVSPPLAALRRRGRRFGGFLLSVLLTLLGLTAVTFVIGRLVPIDPVLAVLGDRATPEVYEKARLAMGLDKSITTQYAIYLGSLIRGDLGTSTMTSLPVRDDLLRVFPATVELATMGILIGLALGVPLGVGAAVWHGRPFDHIARIICLVGYSMPIFWLGLVSLLLFYGKLGLVSGPGRFDPGFEAAVPTRTGLLLVDSLLASDWDTFRDAASHILLPASVLGFVTLATIARMTRAFMLRELGQEYIVAARVKGLPERRVIWVHAFGNILAPLIAVISLSYGSLLEGAVLTETVFAWPGIGLYITRALFNSDMNAVLGGVVVVGAVYVVLNVIADLLAEFADPRTRRR
jgi:peptide/nickel transport system permease protein